MDRLALDLRVADSVSHLNRPDRINLRGHDLKVLVVALLQIVADHGRDALRNRLRRYDEDPAVLHQSLGLGGGEDDIFVVRKDEYRFRMGFFDGIEHIIRAGIHGLSAFDQHIHAKSFEDIAHAVPDRDGYKSGLLLRAIFFFGLFFLFPLPGRLHFGFAEQLLLVLDAHVVDLHAAEAAVFKRFLKCLPRVVGVDMDLDDVVIRHKHQAVPDRGKERFYPLLFLFRERLFQMNDELRTVSVTDFIRADRTALA